MHIFCGMYTFMGLCLADGQKKDKKEAEGRSDKEAPQTPRRGA